MYKEVRLKDCTILERGKLLTKKTATPGSIPVISGGKEPAFYCDWSNRTGDIITVAGSGANAGYVQYWDKPIYVNDAFSIRGKEGVMTKYLYYWLQNKQWEIFEKKQGAGIPHVKISDVEDMMVVVPSMEKQRELVQFLDEFSDATEKLQALLQEEIGLRKKQYVYYRDKLLTETKDSDGGMEKLGEVVSITTGYPFKVYDFKKEGKYPVIKIADIHNGTVEIGNCFVDDLPGKIQHHPVLSGDEILIAMSGSTGKAGYNYNLHDVLVNQRIAIINSGCDSYNGYLKHLIINQNFLDYCQKNATGPQHNVNKRIIGDYMIFVPPLSEQRRIVSILDPLEQYTNELAKQIPNEIKGRQQQYEYYRNMLFDKLKQDT